MTDTIIFDSDVAIDIDDFINFWNDSEYSEHGLAVYPDAGHKDISADLAVAIIGAAATLSTAIVTAALTAYYKRLLTTKTVTVTTETDGAGNVLKVTTEETTTSSI